LTSFPIPFSSLNRQLIPNIKPISAKKTKTLVALQISQVLKKKPSKFSLTSRLDFFRLLRTHPQKWLTKKNVARQICANFKPQIRAPFFSGKKSVQGV